MPTPNRTKVQFLQGSLDLVNDTIKVALYNDSASFQFDPDTHEFVSDVLDGGTTAQEFGGGGGSGYSRKTLSTQAVSQDNTDDEAEFDAADVSWSSLNGETIQGVIVYKEVTDDTDSPIVTVIDDSDAVDLPLPTNGSEIQIQWNPEGILNLA